MSNAGNNSNDTLIIQSSFDIEGEKPLLRERERESDRRHMEVGGEKENIREQSSQINRF